VKMSRDQDSQTSETDERLKAGSKPVEQLLRDPLTQHASHVEADDTDRIENAAAQTR